MLQGALFFERERERGGRAEAEVKVGLGPVERHYWRCACCLVPVAVDGEEGRGREGEFRGSWECGNCGASGFDCMGRVHGAELVDVYERCACNENCQGARGPKCDCRCGGKFHGGGLVTVLEFRGTGVRVPVVTGKRETLAAAAARGLALRDRFLAADKRWGVALDLVPGGWVASSLYWAQCNGRAARRAVQASRTFQARERALVEFEAAVAKLRGLV